MSAFDLNGIDINNHKNQTVTIKQWAVALDAAISALRDGSCILAEGPRVISHTGQSVLKVLISLKVF